MPVRDNRPSLKEQQAAMRTLVRNAPRILQVEVLKQVADNFRHSGFEVRKGQYEAWEPRAPSAARNKGRGLLVNTGALKRSIKAEGVSQQAERTVMHFSSPLKYAAVHNSGGNITVRMIITPKMRKWAWAMWYKTKDARYKGLALTKKKRLTMSVKMPARPFLAPSEALASRIQTALEGRINRALGIQQSSNPV